MMGFVVEMLGYFLIGSLVAVMALIQFNPVKDVKNIEPEQLMLAIPCVLSWPIALPVVLALWIAGKVPKKK